MSGIKGVVEDVREFHLGIAEHNSAACTHERAGPPALIRRVMRHRLLREEFEEHIEAMLDNDVEGVLDAIVDQIYVLVGTALIQFGGERLDAAWAEVHRSNMAKRWPDGTFHVREDGKVLKPPGWVGPDIASIVNAPASDPSGAPE
jgi:hypothetical protein